jgi:hypothetical protein
MAGYNSKSQLGQFERHTSSRNTAAGLSKVSKGQSAVTLNLMQSPSIKTEINGMYGDHPLLVTQQSV